MPEDDYVWLPREDVLHFEEISALVDVFLVARRRQDPPDRRRAAAAPRRRRRSCDDRRQAGAEGSRAHDQRRAARRSDRRAEGRRARAHHRQPRHAAAPIASWRSRASISSTRSTPASPRRAASFGRLKIDTVVIRGVNDDELVDAHRVRHARSTPRSASSSTWTSAAPPAGRPSASFSRREMLDALARHYGAIVADRRTGLVGAGRSLRARGRHDVRHHRVDDRSVLPHLRSQPPDRRRHVVSVPLCDARHRSARAAPRRACRSTN